MMSLVRFQANMFVASWTGVVKFHGPPPVPGSGRIWVANHTSMIDYCVLSSYTFLFSSLGVTKAFSLVPLQQLLKSIKAG